VTRELVGLIIFGLIALGTSIISVTANLSGFLSELVNTPLWWFITFVFAVAFITRRMRNSILNQSDSELPNDDKTHVIKTKLFKPSLLIVLIVAFLLVIVILLLPPNMQYIAKLLLPLIAILAIIVTLGSMVSFWQLRKHAIQRIAKKYGLNFNHYDSDEIQKGIPRIKIHPNEYWPKYLRYRIISGVLNGHKIEIWDNLETIGTYQFVVKTGTVEYKKRTIVDIDGVKNEYKGTIFHFISPKKIEAIISQV